MKILHICNDYCGSKVHERLCAELDRLGAEQMVYAHFEGRDKVGRNRIDSARMQYVYDPMLRKVHHYLFHLRVHDVYASMMRQIGSPADFDLIHAATLFSDGALALKLHRRYGTPYVVAVRKTDVYRFLRLGPHTWPMGRRILLEASKVVFISKALMEAFERHPMIQAMLPRIKHKLVLQPNGIDDYWIDNCVPQSSARNGLIYVGKFDANKNVLRLMDAVEQLQQRIPDVHLDLVGGTDSQHELVLARVKSHPELYTYHGQIFERPLLKELYARNAVFCMPSINETFGLVYIEALSQGLAVLCSRGQGIDGLFAAKVGEFVDPASADAIEAGLYALLTQRENYATQLDFEQFRWSAIACRYMDFFTELITQRV